MSVGSIDATQSETRIEVVAAASAATAAADVVMVSDIGTTITGTNFWTYLTPGAVTGVEPSSGLVGTVVTISGSNLQGGGSEVVTVTLGGIGASISSENNTDVVAVAGASPAATGAVDVVLTANSGAVVTGTGAWSYTFSNITSVSPANGQVGVVVTITGTDLLAGGTSLTTVTLDGTAATVQTESETQVVVVAASSAAGTGDVVLSSNSGVKFI